MPEESSSLSNDCEVVRVCLVGLYRTLCHVSWSISPPTPKLPNAVPVMVLTLFPNSKAIATEKELRKRAKNTHIYSGLSHAPQGDYRFPHACLI